MPWPRRKLVTILDSGSIAGGVPPTEVPATGLGVWYKADTIAGADGALVPVWIDSGPNHFDLSAVGGNQPTIQTSERNGQPVVRFDGVDDYMQTVASILGSKLCGPQAQTVFVVQKQLSTDGGSSTYAWNGTDALNLLNAHIAYTDGNLYYDTGSAAPPTGRLIGPRAQADPWADTWHIVEMVRDGATGSFTIEGNSPVTPTTIPTGTFNGAVSSTLWVGNHPSGGIANVFQGDIAEFIMFNRTLDAAERTQVRNYLKQKWGIAQNKLKLNPASTGYLLLSPSRNDRLALN